MKSKLLAGAAALLLPAFFFSCKNSGNVKPSATGARFELLIVMDDDLWHAPAGQAVFNLFDQDTPGLPQSEPLFKITHVKQADFSDLLKPSRNVLYVDVAADRYTQAKIAYAENYYSYPQCFVRITAPSDQSVCRKVAAAPVTKSTPTRVFQGKGRAAGRAVSEAAPSIPKTGTAGSSGSSRQTVITHSGSTNERSIAPSTTMRLKRWKVSRLNSSLKKR